MDEKGFLLGVGNECKIIYDKGFGGKQLVQGNQSIKFSIISSTDDNADGNRENVTVIECVF